jgi:hypothetical protein
MPAASVSAFWPRHRNAFELREERVDLGLGDAGFAAAIRLGPLGAENLLNHLLDRRIGRRVHRHDPVAVEFTGPEDLRPIRRVGERDRGGVGLAQVLQDLLGGSQDLLPGRGLVVDLGQRQRLRTFLQRAQILQVILGPLDRRDHFRSPHPPVAVGIDQRQGAFVDLGALDRAAQRHPQLLVEVFQIAVVVRGFEPHLVEAAGAEEPPPMRRGRGVR